MAMVYCFVLCLLLGGAVNAYITPMRLSRPQGSKQGITHRSGHLGIQNSNRKAMGSWNDRRTMRWMSTSNEEQFTFWDLLALLTNGVVESRWWGLYNRAISNKGLQALITKSCSSFVGFLLGDLLSQMLTSTSKFNIVRFLRMGTFGALVHAPAGHFFYRNLEKRIPGPSRNAVVKKIIVDQMLWTPLFATLMFSYNGVLAGHALPTVLEAMKTSKSVVTYMITSLLLWPTAHYINYNAVPPNKRLLFINSIQIFFNTIIAGLAATFCRALP